MLKLTKLYWVHNDTSEKNNFMIIYIYLYHNKQSFMISPVKVACVAAIAQIRPLTDQMSYIKDKDPKFPKIKTY